MTREEFMAQYGDAEVEFSSYYKYTFTYRGVLPSGEVITALVGGNADDIYREEISAGDRSTVAGLYPYAATVLNPRTKETVAEFYDY